MNRLPFFIALAEAPTLEESLTPLLEGRPATFAETGGVTYVYINRDPAANPTVPATRWVSVWFKLITGDPARTHTSATTGNWDIWAVNPLPPDAPAPVEGAPEQLDAEDEALALFRFLRRVRRSAVNRNGSTRAVLGPWCGGSTFEAKCPKALADTVLYQQVPDTLDDKGFPLTWKKHPTAPMRMPWVLMGDTPETVIQTVYDPSDKDVDDDVKHVKTTVWSSGTVTVSSPTRIASAPTRIAPR